MLTFIRKNFKKMFTVVLYITAITPAIIGWFLGYSVGESISRSPTVYFFSGAIGVAMGFLIGLICCVLSGGLIAVFFKMDENLQKIVDKMEQDNQRFTEKIDENTQKVLENTDIARKQGKVLNHIRIFLHENLPN